MIKYFLLLLISLNAFAGQTIKTDLTVQGKLKVESTSKGSQPCPVMTEAQRDLVASPQNGDCVFNSTAGTINIYSSTDLAWNEISGTGGGDPGILTNGGFEKGIASWTLASGTASFDTSVKIEGKQALSIALTAQTLSLKQSSTLNASAISGLQGLAYAYALAPVGATLKLCAIQAGVTSTTLCHSLPGTGAYRLYKIPFTLSATSSGVELLSTAAITGTVKVDKAWVGAVDLKVDGAASDADTVLKAAGNAGQSITADVTNISFIASLDSNSAWSGSQYTIPADGIHDIAGIAGFTLTAGRAIDLYLNNVFYKRIGEFNSSSTHLFRLTEYFTKGQVLSIRATGSNGTLSNSAAYHNISITKHGNPARTSTYSSTNADTDWAACSFSTLAWQGLGTVTSDLKCKRQGSDLLMSGKVVLGTTSASVARFLLPTWNGSQLVTASSSKVSSPHLTGFLSISIANSFNIVSAIIQTGQSYFGTSYYESASYSPDTPQNGSTMFGSSVTLTYNNIRIPIEGWENSNVIIGSFAETMNAPGVLKPKVCYGSYGTGGSITAPANCSASPCAEYSDSCGGFSATRSGTGNYTLTAAAGVFAANSSVFCDIKPTNGSNGLLLQLPPSTLVADSSGGFIFGTFGTQIAGGALTDSRFTFKCEGSAP